MVMSGFKIIFDSDYSIGNWPKSTLRRSLPQHQLYICCESLCTGTQLLQGCSCPNNCMWHVCQHTSTFYSVCVFVWSGPLLSLALSQLHWPDQLLADWDCPLIKPLYRQAHRVQGGLSKTKLRSLPTSLTPPSSYTTGVEWQDLASELLKIVAVWVKCHR